MEQVLGRIGENESEEIHVSLQEIRGICMSKCGFPAAPRARVGHLCGTKRSLFLLKASRICAASSCKPLKDGLMRTAIRVSETMQEAGEPVALQEADPQPPRPYKRREPRISVTLPVEAYPPSAPWIRRTSNRWARR